MTILQKRKTLERIAEIESQIKELRRIRMELMSSPYQSATLASGGGSKSYSKMSVSDITETIKELTADLVELKSKLFSRPATEPRQIYRVYS